MTDYNLHQRGRSGSGKTTLLNCIVGLDRPMAGNRSPLFVFWQACRFDLYLSLEMLAELEEVLSRPNIQRFVHPTSGKRFLALLVERAVFIQPAKSFPRSRDPNDDKVVATAVAAKADYLITIDKDLYDDTTLVAALAELGVQVLQPGRFLTLWHSS